MSNYNNHKREWVLAKISKQLTCTSLQYTILTLAEKSQRCRCSAEFNEFKAVAKNVCVCSLCALCTHEQVLCFNMPVCINTNTRQIEQGQTISQGISTFCSFYWMHIALSNVQLFFYFLGIDQHFPSISFGRLNFFNDNYHSELQTKGVVWLHQGIGHCSQTGGTRVVLFCNKTFI